MPPPKLNWSPVSPLSSSSPARARADVPIIWSQGHSNDLALLTRLAGGMGAWKGDLKISQQKRRRASLRRASLSKGVMLKPDPTIDKDLKDVIANLDAKAVEASNSGAAAPEADVGRGAEVGGEDAEEGGGAGVSEGAEGGEEEGAGAGKEGCEETDGVRLELDDSKGSLLWKEEEAEGKEDDNKRKSFIEHGKGVRLQPIAIRSSCLPPLLPSPLLP